MESYLKINNETKNIRVKHFLDSSLFNNYRNKFKGLTPDEIKKIYNYNNNYTGKGQTIAIICAYDYPTAKIDLSIFSIAFKLPKANIKVYYPEGKPEVEANWALESAMGIQWVHAMAPQSKILLVLAKDNTLESLGKAVEFACEKSVDIISMSWGTEENIYDVMLENIFSKYNKTIFLAASGDIGGIPIYPSTSQKVISIGGTTLNFDENNNYINEVSWINSGGGYAHYILIPSWQKDLGIIGSSRSTPDVAFVADSLSGVRVFTSTPLNGYEGWGVLGGTSLSSHCWAGILACINQAVHKNIQLTSRLLYELAGKNEYINKWKCFNDIINGMTGNFLAEKGYDQITGLGSPNINNLIKTIFNMSLN